MNSALTTWRQRILLTLLFTLIAMMLLSPLSSNTSIPNLWDIWNHIATIAHAKLAIAEGQFPLRVAPTEFYGWRYPQFQFYSPTSYTIGGFIYQWLTPSNPFLAYKITLGMALVFGGLFFYRLAFWLVQSKPAALLSSIVYLTSPYYIIVINHVGGFNEAIALGILPATIYYSIQRYYYPKNNIILLQTALTWYLLATIHLITFLYTSIVLALLLLAITLKNRHHWLNLLNVGIGYAFGSMLAMWYLGPIFLLGKYFAITRSVSVDFYAPSLANLFSPTVNISGGVMHGAGYINVISQIHPNLGIPILFAFGMSVYGLFQRFLSRTSRSGYWFPYLLGMFFLAFLMVWSPINIWHRLPKFLSMFQYTWRLLSQVIWVGALLFACVLIWMFKKEINLRQTVLGMIFIMVCSSAWLPITERSFIDINHFLKKPELITNPDSYVLDARKNKNLIQGMDRMTLDAFITKTAARSLNLESSYSISKDLINSLPGLYIAIEGHIPKDIAFHNKQLIVLANQITLNKFVLKPGAYHWNIALNKMRELLKNKSSIQLKFKIINAKNNHISPKVTIPVESVNLTGFMKPSEFLSVNQIEKSCKQQQADTICNIYVPKNIQLLELPILYYPDMLRITLNGKVIPYQNLFYQKYLLTSITPLPNQMNEIKVQFTGMLWANTFSSLAWGMWGLFLLFIVLKKLQTKIVLTFTQVGVEIIPQANVYSK